MAQRLLPAVFLALLTACPTGGNVNGTLRGNQVTLYEGRLWSDARCSEQQGSGQSPLNCCSSNSSYCLDFTDYLIADVRVQGSRIAVLMVANNGYLLHVSDDLGASWKMAALGSIGNIAAFQRAALHLAGSEVYVLVQTKEEAPFADRIVVYPYAVNLASGATSQVPVTGATWLYSRPHAWSGPDGTLAGVTFLPEDARDPNARCLARYESWKPGNPVQVKIAPTGFTGCLEGSVPASDDGRFFPYIVAQPGNRACVFQYDAASDSAGGTCVPWAKWPALRNPVDVPMYAAPAGTRALRYGVFAIEDTAWAVTPTSDAWVSLGAGTPQNNRRPSGRQPFAGLVPLREASGTARFVRFNGDNTADEVLLPLSPCTGGGQTCFDPKNADVFHGEVGDVQWVEPLGGDEYLVFYVHDLAPGINQYKPIFTFSKETATYRRITPLEKPASLGPVGYPNAKPAGPLELMCIKRAACTAASFDFYSCAGSFMAQSAMVHMDLDAAAAEAAAGDCSNLLVRDPVAFDCRARGSTPVMVDNGQGQLFLECRSSVDVSGASCGTCVGNVAVACAGQPARKLPIDCARAGATCQAGACVPATPCTGDGLLHCSGDIGTVCYNGQEQRVRCDLLNMTCDAAVRTPGWNPCIGKGAWNASITNVPLYCQDEYLMWEINGQKWANCLELGFSSCQSGRCVP